MRTFFITIIIFFACCLGALAQEEKRGGLSIQKIVSPKGLEAWFIEDHSAPLISVHFAFSAGSINDPIGKEGLANFLSMMLTEGAGERDSQAFSAALNDFGIRMRFSVDRDYFVGSIVTLPDNQDKAAELLSDALLKPRFDISAFERVMGQLRTKLDIDAKDPQWIAIRNLRDLLYPEHPYARRQRGTSESLARVDVKDLIGFANKYFAKDNLVIGVAGAADANTAGLYIDGLFASLPETSENQEYKAARFANAGVIKSIDWPTPQTMIMAALPGVERNNPDYLALYLANHIFGGGSFTSRLWTELREKRGLTYGAYATLSTAQYAPLIQMGFSTQNENAHQALELLKSQMQLFRSEGVSQAELQNAKDYVIGNYALHLTSIRAVSRYLRGLQLANLPSNYSDTRAEQIRAIDKAQIDAVIKRYYDPEKLRVVAVGQPTGELFEESMQVK